MHFGPISPQPYRKLRLEIHAVTVGLEPKGRRAMQRPGWMYQVGVDEPAGSLTAGAWCWASGLGKHSQELPLLPHLFVSLQLPEPLLQEGNGGVVDCVLVLLPPHGINQTHNEIDVCGFLKGSVGDGCVFIGNGCCPLAFILCVLVPSDWLWMM